MLPKENCLCLIQTLQGETPAASPCSWHWVPTCSMALLKMKKECPVLRVGGKHGQEAAPRGGGHCQAQLRGPYLPGAGSTDTAGRPVATPA